MDIEELNKSQIILLTLLVSFITSIATGIVTVTLMDQAPEGVSRTITHVVERTVNSVAPGQTQVATVVKEVPVIITEEELVVSAINIASPAVGTLSIVPNSRSNSSVQEIGSAFLVRSDGLFVTSGDLVEKGKDYLVVLENGFKYPVTVVLESEGGEVAVLKINQTEVETSALGALTNIKPATIGTASISVGQTVIGIGAKTGNNHSVAMGIVSNLSNASSTVATTISTNAASSDNIGGPIVDIKGRVVGVSRVAGAAVAKRLIQSTIDAVK